uniref:Uncharacterized protein n=1 Tax=Cacopsylla melanoneura TaxID=428564 RepID=A0A8D9BK27_9HEMI
MSIDSKYDKNSNETQDSLLVNRIKEKVNTQGNLITTKSYPMRKFEIKNSFFFNWRKKIKWAIQMLCKIVFKTLIQIKISCANYLLTSFINDIYPINPIISLLLFFRTTSRSLYN